MDIDLLIPVQNNPAGLRDLLASVQAGQRSSSLQIARVLMGDIESDETTREVVREWISSNQGRFPTEVFYFPKNEEVDQVREQLVKNSTADLCLWIEPGLTLPSEWLERLAAPFLKNPALTHGVPLLTGEADLGILLNPGSSWAEVDGMLGSFTPRYPPWKIAATTCFVFRRTASRAPERAIVIDNILLHRTGPSCPKLRRAPQLAHLCTQAGHFLYEPNERELDVLFVLPFVLSRIGGVETVLKLSHFLQTRGRRPGILSLGAIDGDYVDGQGAVAPFEDSVTLKRSVRSVQCVVATSHDSVAMARKVAKEYGAELIYFIQGPETTFESGRQFGVCAEDYSQIPRLVTVSLFLQDYLAAYQEKSAEIVALGPDPLVFYPSASIAREPWTIAACLRSFPEKGSGVLLHNLQLAKQAGFRIVVFGKDERGYSLPADFAERLGDLNPPELRNLLCKVGFYLDCSFLEGLGLLPLEAAFCGAIPILTEKGGPEDLFADGRNALFLPNPFRNRAFFAELRAYPAEQLGQMRRELLLLRDRVSLQKASQEFLEKLPRTAPLRQGACRRYRPPSKTQLKRMARTMLPAPLWQGLLRVRRLVKRQK